MIDTLAAINQMQKDGAIGAYAIGGAVGATFHIEPIATMDIDIFVSFDAAQGLLINMSPLYAYLRERGYEARGEYVDIHGWPVQFLPSTGPLGDEAIAGAIETEVEGVPTRVMSAEHLVALALQVGRAKDHARIVQFYESNVLDAGKLEGILKRNNLSEKWNLFKKRFLSDTQR
jgi:hypothetical protein